MILYHGSYIAINEPYLQYCFKTQELIDKTLKFTGSEEM